MSGYYSDRLSAERLRRCYDIAPPRVRQYLDAEVAHVLRKIRPGDRVLELGCGYGRVLPPLARRAGSVVGIDTSLESLRLGRAMLSGLPNCRLVKMDAVALGFGHDVFDLVLCIQNGISAFHADPRALFRESIRVTRCGGTVVFSTYCDRFWKYRLKWFALQSEAGLLGEIDWEKTGGGVIVCKDGFRATTVGRETFRSLAADFDVEARIVEVDESSLFCEMVPHRGSVGA